MKKIFITFTIFTLSLFGFGNRAFATNNLTQFGEIEANILKNCAEKGNNSTDCATDLSCKRKRPNIG